MALPPPPAYDFSPPPPYSETAVGGSLPVSIPIQPSSADPPSYLQSQISQGQAQGRRHRHSHRPYHRQSNVRWYCGCQPKTWAKIIAIINIFSSVATLLFRFTKLLATKTEMFRNAVPPGFDEYDTPLFSNSSADPMVQILMGFIGLALGYVLFAGAHYGNPQLLLIWMIGAGVGLAFLSLLVFGLAIAVLSVGGLPAFLTLLVVLIPVGVQVFFFKMVSLHRRELIEGLNEREFQTQFPNSVHNPSGPSRDSNGLDYEYDSDQFHFDSFEVDSAKYNFRK